MPRKPHPNGLLDYLLCCYVPSPVQDGSVLPFILDIIPHLKMSDWTPHSVVEEFMKRFDFILTKIIFSFFADGVSQRSLTLWQMQPLDHLSCLEKLSNGVGKQLFLFLQAPMSTYLWAVLSANTPPNTWRAATNDKGWVAASHTITDQKGC